MLQRRHWKGIHKHECTKVKKKKLPMVVTDVAELRDSECPVLSRNPSLSANRCNSVFLVQGRLGGEFPPLGEPSPFGVGLATWCRLSSGVILSKWLKVLLLV